MKRPLSSLFALSLMALSLCSANGEVFHLTAKMDGAQANNGAGTGSSGTGFGIVTYDDADGTLSWNISWTGLSGTPSNMHFHGPAAPGEGAGVEEGVGVAANPLIGFTMIDAGQAADLLAGLWYLNLHTSTNGGGEIRGQVLRNLSHWPLDESTGIVAPSATGGTDADLFTGASWVTDLERGQVLEFDGVDGYASAGMLPQLEPDTNIAWAFWANSAQGENSNVMLGNRFPNEGWIKFTTNAFEYRDLATFVDTINHPPFPTSQWIHHAATKRGNLLTYYRNGLAQGNQWVTNTMPPTPLFFGGDTVNENWGGRMDDVAVWQNSEIQTGAILGLAANTISHEAAMDFSVTAPSTVFTDEFDSDLSQWTVTNRGLEQNAPAGYDVPSVTGGQVTLGGTAGGEFWFGSSIETLDSFHSSERADVMVERSSLTGIGTAYRSSVWIYGDDGHYLHFAQNIGENGWQYNANDIGGTGTLNQTGGGNNLEGVDTLDTDGGLISMNLRLFPGTNPGEVNIEMFVDGVLQGVHGFSNFPATFKVILTGQARALSDSVSAVFESVNVAGTLVDNFPPIFSSNPISLPAATDGQSYSQDISNFASDPEMDAITFSKTGGSAWLSVDANGLITGTPGPGDVGLAAITIQADDFNGASSATFQIRVEAATTPALSVFGWWPLNEGSGSTVSDVSGNGNTGTITNAPTGGLNLDGSAWVEDAECGTVLTFNGDNFDGAIPGAWVEMANPLPVLDLNANFTWSLWVKPDQAVNNDIIVGNRYQSVDAAGVPTDFAPREFVKLTSNQFEWHRNLVGENLNYTDLTQGTWAHLVIVKEGGNIFYYKDGDFAQASAITAGVANAQPIFFGGQGGLEVWRGSLSDVRMYNNALTSAEVLELFTTKGVVPQADPRITSITRAANGAITIEITGKAGKTYFVEGKRNLSDPTWLEIGDEVENTFTLQPGDSILDPAVEPMIFLRARESD
jgi:hypothetical protein